MKRFEWLIALFIVLCNSVNAQVTVDTSVDNYNLSVKYLREGKDLFEKGNYDEAIAKMESSIKLNPGLKDAYYAMYNVALESGNYEITKTYFNKAKSVFEDDDEIIFYLGQLYQKEKNYTKAFLEYNQAIAYAKKNGEDYPVVSDYYANRGICYLRQKKYTEALADFDYSIKLNEMKKGVYANRGFALYKLKRLNEACKSWSKAYELGQTSTKKYIDKYCQ